MDVPFCWQEQTHLSESMNWKLQDRQAVSSPLYPSGWSSLVSVRTPEVMEASGEGCWGEPAWLPAEGVGREVPTHSGVLLSLITRLDGDFLSDRSTLAGGGCVAWFSALWA